MFHCVADIGTGERSLIGAYLFINKNLRKLGFLEKK